MACCFQTDDGGRHLMKEAKKEVETEQVKRRLSVAIAEAASESRYQLMRGGCVVKTSLGPIQFGIPPETVKDSLNLSQEVPTFYILPSKRFDKKSGINVAEFEFPAYFNFFIKRRKCTLICSEEAQRSVRTIFQETLLGPLSFEDVASEFYHSYPKEAIPDFEKELKVFARNPMNPSEELTIDTLLSFSLFNAQGIATIGTEPGKQITIKQEPGQFRLSENGVDIAVIKDEIVLPDETDLFSSFVENSFTNGSGSASLRASSDSTVQQLSVKLCCSFNHDHVTSDPSHGGLESQAMTYWDKKGGHMNSISEILHTQHEISFIPPDFGITVLGSSHGFDPKGTTTGFIVWIYGKGIMVDPPPFSSQFLRKMGIPSVLIHAIIITHCHADHDAGTFTKLLDDTRTEVITSQTIMSSFLRKYSALSSIQQPDLKKLFIFRPVTIGTTLNIQGAQFRFFYAFHTIPCIGFEASLNGRSIYYSADTFYNPQRLRELKDQGVFSEKRYEQLANVQFKADIIIHEAGVPPIHTPQTVLAGLAPEIKNKLLLIHIAEKDLLKDSGLKIARPGIENTLVLHPSVRSTSDNAIRRLDLLSSIDIFESLTIKNIKRLVDSLQQEHYMPKQLIVKENTVGDKFYIIESGVARIFTSSKTNAFQRFYQMGEYFGETALIDEGGKRIANVEAVTELHVLTLEKHDFKFIFGDGFCGDGPVIRKFQNLSNARKQNALHALCKNSVFNEMNQSQKTQLEMILKEEEVEKGQIMWKAGNEATYAFIVKKGNFEFVDCPEANDLDELESGAFVGEVLAIAQRTPLTTTVVATRKSQIFKILHNDLVAFLNKNPGLHLIFQGTKYIE